MVNCYELYLKHCHNLIVRSFVKCVALSSLMYILWQWKFGCLHLLFCCFLLFIYLHHWAHGKFWEVRLDTSEDMEQFYKISMKDCVLLYQKRRNHVSLCAFLLLSFLFIFFCYSSLGWPNMLCCKRSVKMFSCGSE